MHLRRHLLPCAALLACDTGASVGAAALGKPDGARPATPQPGTVNVEFRQTTAEFEGPERGFYLPLTTDLEHVGRSEVADAYAKGIRLLYGRIDLARYRNDDLPAGLLERLDEVFAQMRRGGVKLIVRASYNDPHGETGYRTAQDAPLSRVLDHLTQLKPVWHRNADVIAFVQAGFIGAWGEWHTSSNDLTAPAARTRIKDALLDAVPDSRFVQFRYPPYLVDWTPTPPSVASALSHGFRLGFHNDCFLASATDVGTYDDDPARRQTQQRYTDRLGDIAPFGGETCNPADDPKAAPRVGCAAVLQDGARYNLTYLNASYYRGLFHDRWAAGGCMGEVRRRMGYRIALVSASHPQVAAPGGTVAVAVLLRNDGWARIYNPRAVELLLRQRRTGEVRRLRTAEVDPRRWLPGAAAAVTLRVALPVDLSAGAYDLLLALPDADRRLGGDPRYAVRIANADDAARGQRWDAALGAFQLGTMLEVR